MSETPIAPSVDGGAYTQELSRSLSLGGNILITLSAVTPASSVFIIIPAVLAAVGGASFVAFLASAFVGILMAFCYAELASAFPIAGGEYSFAARVLGKATGFALFLMNALSIILIIGVIALGTGQYLAAAVSGADSKWVGVGVIVLCAIIAVLNIRTNAWVTGTCLVFEMAALVVLTVLGFFHVSRPVSVLFHAQTADSHGVLTGVGLGLVAAQMATAIFAYNGYGASIYFAEETRNAARGIAKAILWSLAITVAAEIIPMTAVVLGAPSLGALISNPAPMQYFITARGSSTLNTIVSLAIAIAIINAVVAITLQGGRTLYSSARDRAYPDPISNFFRYVHPRLQTPLPDAVRRSGRSDRRRNSSAQLPHHRYRRHSGRPLRHRGPVSDYRSHQRHKLPRPLPDAALAPRARRGDPLAGLRHLRVVEGQPLAGHHRRRGVGDRLCLLLRLPLPTARDSMDDARSRPRRTRR